LQWRQIEDELVHTHRVHDLRCQSDCDSLVGEDQVRFVQISWHSVFFIISFLFFLEMIDWRAR
jgi:hypothetical protein